MTCFFYAPFSLPGTGRAHRVERPELSGNVSSGIRRTDQLALWCGRTLERRVRRAAYHTEYHWKY